MLLPNTFWISNLNHDYSHNNFSDGNTSARKLWIAILLVDTVARTGLRKGWMTKSDQDVDAV